MSPRSECVLYLDDGMQCQVHDNSPTQCWTGVQETLALSDALAAAVEPTHSMPRHRLPAEWNILIRAIQQAALAYRATRQKENP